MGHPDSVNTAASAPKHTGRQVEFDDCICGSFKTGSSAVPPVFGLGTTTVTFTASDAVSGASLRRASGQLPPEAPETPAASDKKQSWFDRTWLGRAWNWLWS